MPNLRLGFEIDSEHGVYSLGFTKGARTSKRTGRAREEKALWTITSLKVPEKQGFAES